jgi:hypothetical protein
MVCLHLSLSKRPLNHSYLMQPGSDMNTAFHKLKVEYDKGQGMKKPLGCLKELMVG